jgi:hypothetical protein
MLTKKLLSHDASHLGVVQHDWGYGMITSLKSAQNHSLTFTPL